MEEFTVTELGKGEILVESVKMDTDKVDGHVVVVVDGNVDTKDEEVVATDVVSTT